MTSAHATLVRLVYAAASDRAAWPVFLEHLRVATHSACATLMLWQRETHDSAVSLIAGPQAAETARGYGERFGALNPHLRRGPERMRPGSITFSHRTVDVARLRRTEYYNDYASPMDIEAGIGLPLVEECGSVSHLSCLRPFSVGTYGPRDASFLRPLIPHIQRAVQLHGHLHGLKAAVGTEADAFERLRAAVLVVTRDARVLLANRAARVLLEARDGLYAALDGLATNRASDTQRLRTVIRASASSDAAGLPHPGGVLRLARPSGGWPLTATVARMTLDISYPILPYRCATVVIHTGDAELASADALQRTFGLRPASARLAAQLVAGDSLQAAASRLGIARETARTHLKETLRQSGARSQADFIRLTTRSGAVLVPVRTPACGRSRRPR